MTKKKQQLTEKLDGIGELAGLVLIRKPESASGYYGVRPAGKKWQARVYKPDKLPKAGWDPTLKTYDPGYEGRYAYNPRNTKQFA